MPDELDPDIEYTPSGVPIGPKEWYEPDDKAKDLDLPGFEPVEEKVVDNVDEVADAVSLEEADPVSDNAFPAGEDSSELDND